MSTAFNFPQFDDSDAVRFVRFCGRTADEAAATGARRDCLEFGTMTNFESVCSMLDMGLVPVGECGERADERMTSRAALEAALVAGDVRFGQFPCTVVAGSESEWRLSTEEG